MQRARGRGEIAVRLRDGCTRIDRLFQEGAAKIRLPERQDDAVEAVIINTAGGLTGGDQMTWQATAGEGAHLVVTTQACEKVYRSSGDVAQVEARVDASKGARVAWLPQETILFDRSRLDRTLDVDLAAGATFLGLEAVLFGRTARGEDVTQGRWRERWRIRCEGELVHAEEVRIDGPVAATLDRRAVANGARALATVLLVGDDAADRLDSVRAILASPALTGAGASAWRVGGRGKLLARLLAKDGYSLRQALVPLIGLLNGRAGLPKIWTS